MIDENELFELWFRQRIEDKKRKNDDLYSRVMKSYLSGMIRKRRDKRLEKIKVIFS